MRLIDADALEKEVETMEYDVINREWGESDGFSGACVFNMIADMPTVDPVKHGKWEEWSGIITVGPEGKHHCSLCGGRAPYYYDAGFHKRLTDWCPGCGAKMDDGVGGDLQCW